MSQVVVGVQLWNYEEVAGNGDPVIIMHGWGRSGREWLRIARELRITSGRKIYVVDLPGFGGSGIPKVATIKDYVQLGIEFCEYLKIRRAIFIGHSLGGRVGIMLGATNPKLVEKLILVDPAGVKTKSFKRVILKILARVFSWVSYRLRAKIVGKLMDEDYKKTPALRDLYRAVVAEDLSKYLPVIECPTIVVWGENDPILPLSQTKLYRKLIPNSLIRVVWGAGHDPHIDEYHQLLSILQEAVV